MSLTRNMMRSVLAIEPSADRAAKLRAVAQPHFGDCLTLVDSVNGAFAAIHRGVPELILISPSLPPEKKAELIAGLRALPNATAVQTLTTPDLSTESAAFVTQLKAYVSQQREPHGSRARPNRNRVVAGTHCVDRRHRNLERTRPWRNGRVGRCERRALLRKLHVRVTPHFPGVRRSQFAYQPHARHAVRAPGSRSSQAQ